MCTSQLVYPIIHSESRPRFLNALKEKISLGLVSFISSVSCRFLWVCLTNVSQFLVIENKKSPVSFLGPILSKIN